MSLTLRVGVLMVARDEAMYVSSALQSLIAQSRPADVLVLVNDGSTDDTGRVFDSFENLPSSVTSVVVEHTTGLGRGAARNVGLAALRRTGVDVVVIADADDISLPHRLERVEEHFLSHKGCLAYAGQLQPIDRSNTPIGLPTTYPTDTALARDMLDRGRMPIPHAGAAIRMSVFDAVRATSGMDYAPECTRAQDLELFVAAKGIIQCHTSEEVDVLYRSDEEDRSWTTWQAYRPYHHYALLHGGMRLNGQLPPTFADWWGSLSRIGRGKAREPIKFMLTPLTRTRIGVWLSRRLNSYRSARHVAQ